MANARIGNDAAWTAIRAFAGAATGIPLAAVYQQAQNAPEIRGEPGSCRIWSDSGMLPAGSSWQTYREKRLEVWTLGLAGVVEGAVYAGTVLDTAFSYTAQPGDDAGDIRDGLLASIPASVTKAATGASSITITSKVLGEPVYMTGNDRLVLQRIHKTSIDRAICPAEWTVQFEIVSEVPRDDPDTGVQAIELVGKIEGALARAGGPHAALRAAGIYFRRYAMAAQDLTSLDRAANRSRARVDVIFALDVMNVIEIDRVSSYATPTGTVTA
jgi:hypothetical protein